MTLKNLLNIFGALTFTVTLIYFFPLQRTLDYCAFRLFKPEKISLGFFPTPLHKIDSVKKIYNGPSVYIKRDDLTGLAFGGNKVRKLEYACAQALKEGATMLVTTGPFHSNHCRQTAAAAAHLGLDCTLLLRTPDTQIDNDAYQTVQGNLLLDNLLHAHIVNKDNPENPQSPEELAQLLTEQGHRAYSIPTGASNEIGSIGYIDAFFEIMDQQKKLHTNFTHIVCASGSGGTQVGLVIGAYLFGFTGKIIGISVDTEPEDLQEYKNVHAALANKICAQLGIAHTFTQDDFIILCEYNQGYSVITDVEKNAISFLAQHEGIILDPIYTARAFGGLLDMIIKNQFTKADTILFIHTGGTPAVFTHAEELQ